MYRLDKKLQRKRSKRYILVVVLFIIGSALIYIWFDSKKGGQIKNSEAITTNVVANNSAKQNITEPFYTFELPVDWKFSSYSTDSTINSAEWKSTQQNLNARLLKVYWDKLPSEIIMNRMLPVTLINDQLRVGQLSETCETFTKTSKDKEVVSKDSTVNRLAVWQGVEFLCDFMHPLNNLVGTGMDGQGASLKLSGKSGEHKFLFLYIDHTPRPDYQIFYDAITSFQVR